MAEMKDHIPSDIDDSHIIKMSLEEMKECVIKNANLFYNGETTEIPDFNYDAMISLILKQEPTFNVYEHIKYKDGVRMFHDKDIYREYTKKADISDIDTEEKWNEYCKNFVPMIKYDGSSVVCYYNEDGTLNKIISRGDDESGILQTEKLRNKVPAKVEPGIRILFGEAVCSKYDENGNLMGRSSSNGMINSKYLQEKVDKYLFIRFWDILKYDGSREPYIANKITSYKTFCEIRDTASYTDSEIGSVMADGIVGYPKDYSNTILDIHKIYASEIKEVTLENIEWITAPNSGIIHPKAIYTKVMLDGTNCSKATLNNYQNVINNKMYPGMKIKVAKANVTIPQVVEFINPDEKKCEEYIKSLTCPECGGKLVRYGAVDCVCGEDNCSWWQYAFYCKFFGSGFLTESEETMIWETAYNEYTYLKKLINQQRLIDFFKEDMKLVDFVAIPRLPKATKEVLNTEYKSKLSNEDTVDSLLDKFTEVCYNNLSDLMYEYVGIFTKKLKQYLKNF